MIVAKSDLIVLLETTIGNVANEDMLKFRNLMTSCVRFAHTVGTLALSEQEGNTPSQGI